MVTDYGEGDRTDFIMSPRGYAKLGRNADASAELFKYGVVDIEFKRVACMYSGQNIVAQVHERSKNPDYFAVVVLYVDGMYDVNAVEMWQVYILLLYTLHLIGHTHSHTFLCNILYYWIEV